MTREEAIEIYKGLMNPNIIEAFEVLVPELKEIGYDRMREQIIQGFENWKSNGNLTFNNLRVDDILDWLEKQKKQKPGPISCGHENGTSAEHSCSNDNSEYDKGYMDGKAFQLKQTEQYSIGKTFMGLIPCWVNAPSTSQPAHKYHGRNAVIMHENNGGFRCCFIDDEKATTVHLPEDTLFAEGWRKRPAEWSEEDEAAYNAFICEVINEKMNPTIEQVKWLRGIRDRFKSLHPIKQEWSEEDGEMLNSIIRVVCGIGVQPSNGLREKQVRFLESLRPSWKPSEEQMRAILRAEGVLRLRDQEEVAKRLAELYEQLKKL